MGHWRYTVWFCLAGCCWPAWGQTAAQPGSDDDPMARPSEYGLRFTPNMARLLSRRMTDDFFVQHHKLDKSKADHVSELIARRVMQFAHHNDAAGQEFAEFVFEEIVTQSRANQGPGQNRGLPASLARGIGERVVPLMPSVRDLVNGVMEDVRPELSFTEQLKLTGEVAGANVALDALEKNMRKWAGGEVDPFGNPFEDRDEQLRKDAKGETGVLRAARQTAEAAANVKPGSDWERYVEEAKQYYQMDASQVAAADALLRDYQQRAVGTVGGLTAWREVTYRNKFYVNLAQRLPGGWQNNPLRLLLDREQEDLNVPLEKLGDELKARLEEIPTSAQREAAEQRTRTAMMELGFKFDEPSATAPAEEVAP